VATQGSTSGYSRDLFPHWITISGSCNAREQVLKRDGTSVVVDSACAATSGRWYSPYDGATWTAASDVDIDRVVPLAEAWRSGANSWTTSRRQSFANDLTRPQLIAVTDNVNQSKGDQDPVDLAAVPVVVPVHLQQDVDHREVQLGPDPAVVGEVRAAEHAQHLQLLTTIPARAR
jgi:hypothetical protein